MTGSRSQEKKENARHLLLNIESQNAYGPLAASHLADGVRGRQVPSTARLMSVIPISDYTPLQEAENS